MGHRLRSAASKIARELSFPGSAPDEQRTASEGGPYKRKNRAKSVRGAPARIPYYGDVRDGDWLRSFAALRMTNLNGGAISSFLRWWRYSWRSKKGAGDAPTPVDRYSLRWGYGPSGQEARTASEGGPYKERGYVPSCQEARYCSCSAVNLSRRWPMDSSLSLAISRSRCSGTT